MMRILRAADRVAVPWRNGGGVTREVAVSPPGAGFDDFDWRVSIAEVCEAGPFSTFDGIDRTLVVLEGHMELAFSGTAVELKPGDTPLAFPGDVSCSGYPIGGPVTDLNVMVRRGRATSLVHKVTGGETSLNAKATLVVAIAPTRGRAPDGEFTLRLHDAVLTDPVAGGQLSLDGEAFVIRFV